MSALDPFLLDADQLAALASEPVVRRGVAYFREHRVVLAGALLCASAFAGGCDEAPKAARAAVWLYSEAVPRGWASPEDAALTLRVLALQDADAVPVGLLDAVLTEGRRAMSRAGPVTAFARPQA